MFTENKLVYFAGWPEQAENLEKRLENKQEQGAAKKEIRDIASRAEKDFKDSLDKIWAKWEDADKFKKEFSDQVSLLTKNITKEGWFVSPSEIQRLLRLSYAAWDDKLLDKHIDTWWTDFSWDYNLNDEEQRKGLINSIMYWVMDWELKKGSQTEDNKVDTILDVKWNLEKIKTATDTHYDRMMEQSGLKDYYNPKSKNTKI